MTGFVSAKSAPPSKSPDDHRRQHAAMNHDTTRAVVKLLRHLGYDADADALEAQQALVWQPVTMRTAPGELVGPETERVAMRVETAWYFDKSAGQLRTCQITTAGDHDVDRTIYFRTRKEAEAAMPPAARMGMPYDDGPAPDVMALAAAQRAEKNADRRLPVEKDE